MGWRAGRGGSTPRRPVHLWPRLRQMQVWASEHFGLRRGFKMHFGVIFHKRVYFAGVSSVGVSARICTSTNRWNFISRAICQHAFLLFQSLRLPPTNWKKAVIDWYDEVGNIIVAIWHPVQVRLFSRKDVKPFVFNSAIGHFSQLVWAETYKVWQAIKYQSGVQKATTFIFYFAFRTKGTFLVFKKISILGDKLK